MNVKDKVYELLEEHFGVDRADITDEMSLKRDLNVPDVELADFFPKLEDTFNIVIDPHDAATIDTIADVIVFVSDHYEEIE